MSKNVYAREDRQSQRQLRSAGNRKFKSNQGGLVMQGGTVYTVGHQTGGIPDLDNDEDDDANESDGDDSDTTEDTENVFNVRAMVLLGSGPTPPTPKRKRRGKCWLLTGENQRNVLLICLRGGGATATYVWEPVIGGGY